MIRNILSNWTTVVITAAISIGMTPIMIAGLGHFYYGLWVLVASLVDYYGLLDAGIRITLQRFVARHNATGARTLLNETFMTALALTGGVGLIIIALSALVACSPWTFGLTFDADAHARFRALMLCLGASVGLSLPASLLGAYLCGLQRFDLYNLGALLCTAVRAGLIIFGLQAGMGVVVVGVATLAGTLALLGVNALLVRSVSPDVRFDVRLVRRARARELLSFSVYMFIYTIGDYTKASAGPMVIAHMLGVAMITPYSVATRILDYLKFPVHGVLGPFMPRMSELDAQQRRVELQTTFVQATRMTALLASLIGWFLVLSGEELIRLWLGEGFDRTVPILLVLLSASWIALAQAPSSILLVACGKHRPFALWTISEAVVNVGLSFLLVRWFGLLGVAVGAAVPWLLTRGVLQPWYALRILGLPFTDYLKAALARPVVVNVVFLGVWVGTQAFVPPRGAGQMAWTISWQVALFLTLSVMIGVSTTSRRMLWQRARRFASLLLAMATLHLGMSGPDAPPVPGARATTHEAATSAMQRSEA